MRKEPTHNHTRAPDLDRRARGLEVSPEMTISVESDWNEIHRVGAELESFFEHLRFSQEQCIRYTMIACELVENAIKYGHFSVDSRCAVLHVRVSGSTVLVQVTNPVHSEVRSHLQELDRTIQWTRGFQDPFEAYIERVKAISGEPLGMKKSCLGIARIAYEGRAAIDFYLDENERLCVAAVSTVV